MPLVEVTLVDGRTPDQIRSLIHEVTAAVVKALDVPRQSVRVAVRELPKTHWAAGDVTIAEREAANASGEGTS
ncbi:tautomerase family protein [Streptomyces diastatochromogenes]|uniref:4-oxalocrotonate tautomerase n=1 Tax=Streptomyces diastatochromogenes TaxID=42236 RepID=A0A233RR18_STRDA|nr:tautomerase family protein [Streptomyces diastatochromogenes]MCZ0984783.1 tautomerase family protein [Streptomyces diastatochromogenes]OXY85830.1 4-oxalocrotonate tautomerase [Streptomyces diastatochromogenes]